MFGNALTLRLPCPKAKKPGVFGVTNFPSFKNRSGLNSKGSVQYLESKWQE